MAAAASGVEVWQAHARQWRWLGSPLRPAPEDISFTEAAVFEWYDRAHPRGVQALLLGVTPELALMEWPAYSRLTALDHSADMIAGVWPGAPLGQAVLRGAWNAAPLRAGSQHVVVGDGCLVLLPAREHAAFFAEVRRVLVDDGLLVLRVFLRPETPEPVPTVLNDLARGRISSVHAFKWRLAAALHGRLEEGVALSAIWETAQPALADAAGLERRLGWAREALATLEAYRGSASRYTFPTLDEARAAFAPYFEEKAYHAPEYELGERCPTLVLRPR